MTVELLREIVSRLEKIEEILSNRSSINDHNYNHVYANNKKQLEIKETRVLMQDIVKSYKNTLPSIDIAIGTKLHIFRFRDTVAKVKNIRNTKFEYRRLMKSIRKLEEYEFVRRDNAEMVEVLDTGIDWSQL